MTCETRIQSQVKSYQRLKKMVLCLKLNNLKKKKKKKKKKKFL